MMSQVIRQETVVFLTAVLHGALLALAYDLLRALRRVFAHSLAAVSAEDFLFWMAAGFLSFCLLFLETDGVIRGYVVVGAALGVILYLNLFSRLVLRIVTGILGGIRAAAEMVGKAAGKVKKAVGWILKKVAGKVKRAVGEVFGKVKKAIGKILEKIIGKFMENVVFCRSIVHKKIKKRIENAVKKVYNKRSRKLRGGKGDGCKQRRISKYRQK